LVSFPETKGVRKERKNKIEEGRTIYIKGKEIMRI
jgi:hypothetical protein